MEVRTIDNGLESTNFVINYRHYTGKYDVVMPYGADLGRRKVSDEIL